MRFVRVVTPSRVSAYACMGKSSRELANHSFASGSIIPLYREEPYEYGSTGGQFKIDIGLFVKKGLVVGFENSLLREYSHTPVREVGSYSVMLSVSP